jgi:hypothetical protein
MTPTVINYVFNDSGYIYWDFKSVSFTFCRLFFPLCILKYELLTKKCGTSDVSKRLGPSFNYLEKEFIALFVLYDKGLIKFTNLLHHKS